MRIPLLRNKFIHQILKIYFMDNNMQQMEFILCCIVLLCMVMSALADMSVYYGRSGSAYEIYNKT